MDREFDRVVGERQEDHDGHKRGTLRLNATKGLRERTVETGRDASQRELDKERGYGGIKCRREVDEEEEGAP